LELSIAEGIYFKVSLTIAASSTLRFVSLIQLFFLLFLVKARAAIDPVGKSYQVIDSLNHQERSTALAYASAESN
jgi:hypothetical protein